MNGTSTSGWKFSTRKSTRKISNPTCTNTSSTTPSGLATNISSNYKIMVLGLVQPNPKFFYWEVNIKFMPDPRPHNPHRWMLYPIVIWTIKLPRSFSLVWNFFWILELHSLVSAMVSYSFSLLLFSIISFVYWAYLGIPWKNLPMEN